MLWTEQGFTWVTNWQQYPSVAPSPLFTAVLNGLLHLDLKQRYTSAQQALQDLQATASSLTLMPSAPHPQPSGLASWVKRLLGKANP
jgi:hypothetical protein